MAQNQLTTKQLFQALEDLLPSDFPEGSWYIIAPDANRGQISARLRDVITKSWTLVGMPKAISASYSLQDVDSEGDLFDENRRFAAIANTDALSATSRDWFRQVFGSNEEVIFARFKNHVDMEWALRYIVYGVYLGDLSHLSVIENEFLVATCVVTTGGPRTPSVSHLNALLRVGVTRAQVEAFEQIYDKVSHWAGVDTSKTVRLRDITPKQE